MNPSVGTILNSAGIQVSSAPDSAVTESVDARQCRECGAPLTGKQRSYCGSACKQAAYRKDSPAHAALLVRQKNQRALRRLEHHREFNRNRSYGFDGMYNGPARAGMPRRLPKRLPCLTAEGIEKLRNMNLLKNDNRKGE